MAHAFDPEFDGVLAALPSFGGDVDLPTARQRLKEIQAGAPAPDTSDVEITDLLVPGPDAEVPVRIFRPHRPSGPIGVLDVHGGGFIMGDLDGGMAANVAIARSVGAVVVSVDYRLAPEYPFPAGLEDCFAALNWFARHAGEYGVDPERIAIHGISAGGGLCAALALLARDRGGPSIAFQYLGVPEVDDRLASRSMAAFVDTPMWNRPAAVRSWECYLGEGVPGTDGVSPYAAPSRATDFTELPPAYVSAQAFDPLRDEGIAYAQALLAAGVPVELHLFPGTFHGSLSFPAQVSKRETRERVAVLRHALGVPPR